MNHLVIKSNINHAENEISITSNKYDEIKFLFPYEPLPSFSCHDYALWAILPLAMKNGDHIEIHEPISKRAYDSVKKIANIWYFWIPNFYKKINITAHNIIESNSFEKNNKNLMCFSGGIDSTYSAFKLQQDNIKNVDSLTVHGMDYKFKDTSKFDQLMEKTKKLRNSVFTNSHFVKTNIYAIYSQHKCNPSFTHVTHIFSLFASLSIFEGYEQYLIASDDRLDQQFLIHPYGSNSASNRLMKNSTGNLVTLDDDVTRLEKTKYLAENEFDLNSLSVCGNAKARPYNCGICVKCLRTKSMLLAILDYVPNIFVDNELGNDWFSKIDLTDLNNQMYAFDTLLHVESKNAQDSFPGFDNLRKKLYTAMLNRETNKLKNYTKFQIVKAIF
ncbi:hypothetical protein [Acinetobacter brisouii]|uniref:hypothetical protein n=1 Tax=Acinetobacter brisouii TaxID=396323 RepID=UPI001250CA49|nr:hypothetical protein [Acinetobacter brisouii]